MTKVSSMSGMGRREWRNQPWVVVATSAARRPALAPNMSAAERVDHQHRADPGQRRREHRRELRDVPERPGAERDEPGLEQGLGVVHGAVHLGEEPAPRSSMS